MIFGVFWGKLMRRVFIWAAIDGRDGDAGKAGKDGRDGDTRGSQTYTATKTRGEGRPSMAATGTLGEQEGKERGGRDGPPLILG